MLFILLVIVKYFNHLFGAFLLDSGPQLFVREFGHEMRFKKGHSAIFILLLFKKFFIYFFYFLAALVFLTVYGLFSISRKWGLPFSCSSQATYRGVFSCCRQSTSSRHLDLVGLWYVDATCVPCIGRQILIHCTTREVLDLISSWLTFALLFLKIPSECYL